MSGRILFVVCDVKVCWLGSELERSRLSEKVKELERQAEEERASHRKAMKHLQAEVKSGTANITQLESTLHQRQMELEGHLTRVEEDSSHHKTQMWHLRHQVWKILDVVTGDHDIHCS